MYDPVDERGVPQTRGIPVAVRIAATIGILSIFGIGGAVIAFSGYGHAWPSQKTLRLPLTSIQPPQSEGQTPQ
jgi:hypothetical protein